MFHNQIHNFSNSFIWNHGTVHVSCSIYSWINVSIEIFWIYCHKVIEDSLLYREHSYWVLLRHDCSAKLLVEQRVLLFWRCFSVAAKQAAELWPPFQIAHFVGVDGFQRNPIPNRILSTWVEPIRFSSFLIVRKWLKKQARVVSGSRRHHRHRISWFYDLARRTENGTLERVQFHITV